MKLSELKTGERAVVVKVYGHGSFRKRIIEMGFVKGNKVKVILNAPLRDPIEYEIIGYKISLRREEASKIEVISESEAKQVLSSRESLPALESDEAYIDRAMDSMAEQRRKLIKVALVGNPNCGKTSLFNIASGSHEHVGNYSGVTVDAKEGRF
jgi:ferrous iron transport protein B